MIDFVIGGIALNDDFFFRREFIDDLWDSLRKDHVLLVAPRRMGKTSVMYYMLHNPQNNMLPVHLNVEHINNPGDFFLHLIDAIKEHQQDFFNSTLTKTWKFLKQVYDTVDNLSLYEFKVTLRKSDDWNRNWKQRGDELIKIIEKSGKPLMFIIDELPDMIIEMQKEHADQVIPFLHYFRNIRQKKSTKIRWLVGGSVNIRGTLEQIGQIKLINDFKIEILPPFTRGEVEEFVEKMLTERKVQFSEDIILKMQSLLGTPIPIFLQMFTQELYRYWRKTGNSLTPEIANTVFNESLLGEVARDKLQHNRNRIELYYPEDQRGPAVKILTEISKSEHGISKDKISQLYYQVRESRLTEYSEAQLMKGFDQLLYFLETDFYIEEKPDRLFDFSSRLLKLWWRKNYA